MSIARWTAFLVEENKHRPITQKYEVELSLLCIAFLLSVIYSHRFQDDASVTFWVFLNVDRSQHLCFTDHLNISLFVLLKKGRSWKLYLGTFFENLKTRHWQVRYHKQNLSFFLCHIFINSGSEDAKHQMPSEFSFYFIVI